MRSKRPRDSQRSKVYAAERAIPQGRELASIPEIEKYIKRKMKLKGFKKRWPGIHGLRVMDGRGRRSACGWGQHGVCFIKIPRWYRNEIIVLHELAHGILWNEDRYNEHPPHGWRFARTMLDLVRYYMGQEAAAALRKSFVKHRVKYNAPRKGKPLSPEARAAACRRLEEARRKKKVASDSQE